MPLPRSIVLCAGLRSEGQPQNEQALRGLRRLNCIKTSTKLLSELTCVYSRQDALGCRFIREISRPSALLACPWQASRRYTMQLHTRRFGLMMLSLLLLLSLLQLKWGALAIEAECSACEAVAVSCYQNYNDHSSVHQCHQGIAMVAVAIGCKALSYSMPASDPSSAVILQLRQLYCHDCPSISLRCYRSSNMQTLFKYES